MNSRTATCPRSSFTAFKAILPASLLSLSWLMLPISVQIGLGGEHSLACGCEVIEPTCEVATCGLPCESDCDDSCDSSGCDGCGTICRLGCSSRRFGLPGLGEGLLAGLDKMTDRFEQSVGRMVGSNYRTKPSCSLCMSQVNHSAPINPSYSDFETVQALPTQDTDSYLQDDVPVSPVPTASPTPTPDPTPNLTPNQTPLAPPALPKPELLGNPFLDEARSSRRNAPEVYVAKVHSSVRGSTRRRYTPPSQTRVVEAVELINPSAQNVITAGAVESPRQSSDYAR